MKAITTEGLSKLYTEGNVAVDKIGFSLDEEEIFGSFNENKFVIFEQRGGENIDLALGKILYRPYQEVICQMQTVVTDKYVISHSFNVQKFG